MKAVEKILVILMVVLLVLPAIQVQTGLFPVKELDGSFKLAGKPEFTWESWFKGEFQAKFNDYIEDHIGFRNVLVRIANQIDFSLFKIPHAEGVVIGKDYQLFEYDYIREYIGEDYLGEEIIDKRIRMFKFLQEYLKKEKNIDLILVFEPGKASVLPEYIPGKYLKNGRDTTNTEMYLKKVEEYGVRYIDFENYFHQLKEHSDYPLYAKYGIHWSIYGMSFAADSLIKYIEAIRGIDMPEVIIDSFEVEKYARYPDYDVARTLNLLFVMPNGEDLAYPVYSFGDTTGKERPDVLVVGDSYYWNIYNTRIPGHLFNYHSFWYFNHLVYPDTYYKEKTTGQLDLKSEIEKREVILLMVTKRFLYKFDWGFIGQLYDLYAPVTEYDKIFNRITDITGDELWFEKLIKESKDKGVSLGSLILNHAEYSFKVDNKDEYLVFNGVKMYMDIIKNDSSWFAVIKKRAKEENISIEKSLRQNSEYMFWKDHKNLFNKYRAVKEQELRIEQDKMLSAKADSLAKTYYLTHKEAVRLLALQLSGLQNN